VTDELPSIHSLTIENLSCIRGGRLLFRELSFSVASGQVLSIEGPNGSGKTSLLRMIAGFLAPAQGSMILKTAKGITEPEERARQVGWLGHQDGAKPQLTPVEVLGFFSDLYGNPCDIIGALVAAGLQRCADLPCQYLSAGQKKRLALARLAISKRPLWLLDEPLAALDSDGKAFAAELIATHCASGGIALAATHEPLSVPAKRLSLGVP
jgi:heme exporter protein A